MTQIAYDFPLAALVGQEQLKSALLLCAVNPGIGGVLIRGDKGSAKSTGARGLAGVMAPIERVVGCAYNCAPGEPAASCEVCGGVALEAGAAPLETTSVPFVNLPLGASEDRVLGSLDFERALKDGRKAFQPGLLASAHRGILYIDEVNLLPDHLVDVLLDAAAMGVNRVQREGLSVQHPARIALVGTMNQEEGELRPQLLDRFGLMVEVRAPQEPRLRAEIVRRRLAWEADPGGFCRSWDGQQTALREQVVRAQGLLPKVTIVEGLLLLISELCCSQAVTSLRADLVMNKAARALAALDGRTSVEPDDLSQAAMLVLPHRRRAKPFEQPGLDEKALEELMRRVRASEEGGGGGDGDRDSEGSGDPTGGGDANGGGAREPGETNGRGGHSAAGPTGGNVAPEVAGDGAGDEAVEHVFAAGSVAPAPRIELKSGLVAGGVVGRRSVALEARRGREVRAVPNARPTDLAVTATLHHSLMRTGGLSPAGRLEVTAEDLHQKVRAGRQGNLMLFVVDASGSMAALQRMEMVKATVLSLLRDAYERRDEIGVIAFRGTKAELLLAPTRSVDTAEKQLRDLPTGGRTPLAHALQVATDVLNKNSGASRPEPLLIVVSDGKANVALDGTGDGWQQALECAQAFGMRGTAALVLDTEVGFVRMGRAGELAAALGAQCLSLEKFSAETLALTIRGQLQANGRRRTGGV
ncbi:MAG TPA: magnesium chelatase subunit D family protein [Steroidobacteraceae bacterium]